MKNIIYEKTIVPASKSEDGQTPTRIILTQEVNGDAVFHSGFRGTCVLQWFDPYQRNMAIEQAVALAVGRKTHEGDAHD